MATTHSLPTGALRVRVGPSGTPFYEAKWRLNGQQRLRRVGPAWLELVDGEWRRRRGRVPETHFDEKRATVRMAQLIADDAEDIEQQRLEEERAGSKLATFREVAQDWLEWREHVKGARPSTLRDLRSMLAEPGAAYGRGRGTCKGRIMLRLGDRPAARITSSDVSRFLRDLDGTELSPRSVNKHREVLSAIFGYAQRADSFNLPGNPVEGTDKRREPPAAALDFYEPDEVELLARAAADGRHRRTSPGGIGPDEIAARCAEDAQDAELFRLLAYTGLRIGEALALRWGDVDLPQRRLIVQRAMSAGMEGPTKGWQVRYVPIADAAYDALQRLRARGDFTTRDDHVVCGRLGGPLDDSALRRRYRAAVKAAGLRYIKLHGLRHGAGSLVARQTDAVFVQHFLGHANLATTERYMHAKARIEDIERLNRAFGSAASGSEIENAG